MAEMLIRNELLKGKAGDSLITDDVIKELNEGGKKSPFSDEHPAFEKGNKSVSYGTIVISKTNLRALKSGQSVTLYAPKGNKKIVFDLKNITITKE